MEKQLKLVRAVATKNAVEKLVSVGPRTFEAIGCQLIYAVNRARQLGATGKQVGLVVKEARQAVNNRHRQRLDQ